MIQSVFLPHSAVFQLVCVSLCSHHTHTHPRTTQIFEWFRRFMTLCSFLLFFFCFFSPVHSYSIRSKSSALLCRTEHDYIALDVRWRIGTAEKIVPCTFTQRHVVHDSKHYYTQANTETTECFSYVVNTLHHCRATQEWVRVCASRIRRFLGRHTKADKIKGVQSKEK